MENRNEELWRIAKKRVSFRRHFFIYALVNGMLVLVWFLTTYPHLQEVDQEVRFWAFWPIWPILGWGIGLASHYYEAFVSPKENSVEREYERLLKERQ